MKTSKTCGLLLQSTALAMALSFGISHAQENPDEPVEVTAPEDTEAPDEARQEKVYVTGSRLQQDTFTSAAAVDVLTAEEASIEGLADVASLLQSSTAAAGSPQVNAAVSNNFVTDGGLGAETLSLRGLGANRTLILLNGRRAGPSGTRGSVSAFDLNSIPLGAVERVEILKDGASAIYGSDAIAGVVNIITKRQDGGSIDGFFSLPEGGAGEQFRLSATYGKEFERGGIQVTFDYYNQKELARGDRDYLKCGESYAFNPDGSRADVIDPRTGEFQCADLLWGHIWIYDYMGADSNVPDTFPYLAQYDYDGSLAQYLPGYPAATIPGQMTTPPGWFPIYYDQNDIDGLAAWNGITVGDEARGLVNYDHPFQDAESLIPEVERVTLYVDGEFEITPNVTAYGEALFNRRVTSANGYRQYWTYQYGETAFGGPANPEASAQGWGGDQWFSPTAITDINDDEVTIDYQRYVAGVRGDFGGLLDGWIFDASYQYSKSEGEYNGDYIYDDSISDYWFQFDLCGAQNGGLTSTGRQCVDVPWFSPDLMNGVMSDEVRNFLFTNESGNTEYTQSSFEAYVSGPVFELPAGALQVAVGFLYQEDEILDTPAPIVLAGNAWGDSASGITQGQQDQKAYYAEIQVPILADQPFFKELTLSASGRLTDISTVEDTGDNYRVALNWAITDEWRIRATQGTSFRAPGLFELYLANETSFSNSRNFDPCIEWGDELNTGGITQRVADNCAAEGIPDDYTSAAISSTIFRGGGLGRLEPETSDNFSAGIIWTPKFIDLSIALDYFDIEINGEIATLNAATILNGCYNSESFPNDPLCSRFIRGASDSPYRVTEVYAEFININSQVNEGIDLSIRYGTDTPWGDLTIDSQFSYQLESYSVLLAESQIQDYNGEFGEPLITGYVNFVLDVNPEWNVFYGMDIVGPTDQERRYFDSTPNPTLYGNPVQYRYETEAIVYHTFSAEYRPNDDWSLRVGIRNIFDEHPPAVSAADSGNSLIASQYDFIGRRVFVNVSKRF